LEEVIQVGLPSEEERGEILRIAFREMKRSGEVDEKIERIGRMLEGYSAAEIVGICQRAGIRALMDGREVVEFGDLREEVD
jgi:ATP-dependent 26S proteasome regulatory subunit